MTLKRESPARVPEVNGLREWLLFSFSTKTVPRCAHHREPWCTAGCRALGYRGYQSTAYLHPMDIMSSPLPLKPGTRYQSDPSTVGVQRCLTQSVQVYCHAPRAIIQGLPGMPKVANTKLADYSSKDHCTQWNEVLNKTVEMQTCYACKACGHSDQKSFRCA